MTKRTGFWYQHFAKGPTRKTSAPPFRFSPWAMARPARDTSDHHHPRPRRPPVLVLFHCLPAPLHYGQVQAATFGHEHDAAAEAAVVRRAGAPSKIQSQFQHTNRSEPEWGTWNKSRLQPFFTASAPEFRTYPTPSSTQSRKDTRVPGTELQRNQRQSQVFLVPQSHFSAAAVV